MKKKDERKRKKSQGGKERRRSNIRDFNRRLFTDRVSPHRVILVFFVENSRRLTHNTENTTKLKNILDQFVPTAQEGARPS